MLSVEAVISPSDLEAFSKHVQQRVLKTHAPRWRLWVGATWVGVCVGAIPVFILWLTGRRIDLGTMVITIITTWLGFLGYSRFRASEFIPPKLSWNCGRKRFVIDDTSIRQIGESHEGRIDRSNISDVVLTKEHVFVLFGNVSGWVIPRSAFRTADEAGSFAEALGPHTTLGCVSKTP